MIHTCWASPEGTQHFDAQNGFERFLNLSIFALRCSHNLGGRIFEVLLGLDHFTLVVRVGWINPDDVLIGTLQNLHSPVSIALSDAFSEFQNPRILALAVNSGQHADAFSNCCWRRCSCNCAPTGADSDDVAQYGTCFDACQLIGVAHEHHFGIGANCCKQMRHE
ncbi:unannotated protein [freshwater metagenome]|uniref:Unannotated protein n=1 Tax=freshwater metagenome TaxID=449393 RepID=A0A6J7RW18_9ZZZZ